MLLEVKISSRPFKDIKRMSIWLINMDEIWKVHNYVYKLLKLEVKIRIIKASPNYDSHIFQNTISYFELFILALKYRSPCLQILAPQDLRYMAIIDNNKITPQLIRESIIDYRPKF